MASNLPEIETPPIENPPNEEHRIRRFLFGKPRDLADRTLLKHIALVPLLAWVGLGSDGLSSSAYGPEEAFRALGDKTYLAIPLAIMVCITVLILSSCYSRIIEHFPLGGGGYVVATTLLGKYPGLVSGSALMIDYILTITVSVAAASSALFSILPSQWAGGRVPVAGVCIIGLIILNLRGVRESVVALTPIFILFLVTHALLIVGGIIGHFGDFPTTIRECSDHFRADVKTEGLGAIGLALVFAFSLGGGTFTGIEAVSNGVSIMREPRVQTAKRTMLYMGISLAAVASGLLVCFLLWDVDITVQGKVLNAVLFERIASNVPGGSILVILALASAAALLVVAAQTGFIDGPRVLATMSQDSWAPRRFASLSERLTTQDGIVLMGVAAIGALWYTWGEVHKLVVMYSINVFVTFTLSTFGMSRWCFGKRKDGTCSNRETGLFFVGFCLCLTILAITLIEKFGHGGWVTLVATSTVVTICVLIRRHYESVAQKLKRLDSQLVREALPFKGTPPEMDKEAPTAAILVANFDGLGIHLLLNIPRVFPGTFKNFVFVSVGVVDSSDFRGEFVIDSVRKKREEVGAKYVALANSSGLPAVFRYSIGTEVVDEAVDLCLKLREEFPRLTFFGGKIVFEHERWLEPLLHNQTAFAIQRRLQWSGSTMVIMPVRV
jgi:amino acid transporter